MLIYDYSCHKFDTRDTGLIIYIDIEFIVNKIILFLQSMLLMLLIICFISICIKVYLEF